MRLYKPLLLAAILVLAHMMATSQNNKGYTIKNFVNEMAAIDIYERSATVGYTGSASRQLELFKKLRSLASENELTELASNHKDAVVRLYAFHALKEKTKNVSQTLVKKFEADNTEVVTLTGCLGDKKSVRRLAFEPIIQEQLNSFRKATVSKYF